MKALNRKSTSSEGIEGSEHAHAASGDGSHCPAADDTRNKCKNRGTNRRTCLPGCVVFLALLMSVLCVVWYYDPSLLFRPRTRLLVSAASSNRCKAIKLLLLLGADVNSIDPNTGGTPLQWAAGKGNIQAVKLLLANGADIDAIGHPMALPWTPLAGAAAEGHWDIAKFLLANGADINGSAHWGWTPLWYVMCCGGRIEGREDMVEFLLQKGATIDSPDHDGRTLLHRAVERGHVAPAKFLIERGADINARDRHEKTPLHLAASEGQAEMVSLLLSMQADANPKDSRRSTPLHHAALLGLADVADILVVRGADVNARDCGGRTPLDCARGKLYQYVEEEDWRTTGRNKIVVLLRQHGGKTGKELEK
ncbi:MAG: ankyrin repeat domain-containing protein [Planctomycetota bacterium]